MAIEISLDSAEALVLFDLLASEKLNPHVDAPERIALWALEGKLEKQLTEPLSPEYDNLLHAARKSLGERFGE